VKLKERQAVTAGIVMSVVLTAAFTATALTGTRTETFIKTLGSCAIAVGVVWFLVRQFNNAQDDPKN